MNNKGKATLKPYHFPYKVLGNRRRIDTQWEADGDVPLMKSLGEVRVVLKRSEAYCEWRIEEAVEDPLRTRRMLETNAIRYGGKGLADQQNPS